MKRYGSLVLALTWWGIACGEEAAPVTLPVPSSLAVSPSQLRFSDTSANGRIFLTTSPSGGRLDWQLTGKPAWLTVTPDRGTVAGSPLEVSVNAAALAQLDPGTLTGRIEFVSNGGAGVVEVTGVSLSIFRMSVSPSTLDAAETVDTLRFFLKNTGKSAIFALVNSPVPWLTVGSFNGSLARGDSVRVSIAVNREPLPAGATTTSVTIRNFNSSDSVQVPISVRTAAAPKLVFRAPRLTFTPSDSVSLLTLSNSGKGPLTWSLAATAPWLQSSPTSGTIAAGASTTATVRIERSLLTAPTAAASLSLTTNTGQPGAVLPVTVTSAPGFPPGLTTLDHHPIDAEGNEPAGLIVTVSDAPARLTIIDALDGRIQAVPLARPPTAVSISPDGLQAAVGHDGAMTLVDLINGRVVREYTVPVDILDLVLANSEWAYAFPRRDQWTAIQSVRLSTGLVTTTMNHPGIYAGTLGRLHPSGQSIYGSQNNIGPADHERYDIRGGAAERLYDSRYHGDYAMGGNAWFSADGSRLFGMWGNVFSLSSTEAQDMLYAGRLAPLVHLNWVEDVPQLSRILSVGGGTDSLTGRVMSHDRTTLLIRGRVTLPTFTVGGSPVAALARYVFAVRDRAYVLARTDPLAQTAPQWGLVRVDRAAIP